MKTREVRYLILLVVLLLIIGAGAVFLVNLQQNADRARTDQQILIETQNAGIEQTATAQAK